MLVASLTTSNEAWGRNPHVPRGFVAARGRPRRCRSSAMTHIAVVAAPRGRPRGATNATHAITRTHSQGPPAPARYTPFMTDLLPVDAVLSIVLKASPVLRSE